MKRREFWAFPKVRTAYEFLSLPDAEAGERLARIADAALYRKRGEDSLADAILDTADTFFADQNRKLAAAHAARAEAYCKRADNAGEQSRLKSFYSEQAQRESELADSLAQKADDLAAACRNAEGAGAAEYWAVPQLGLVALLTEALTPSERGKAFKEILQTLHHGSGDCKLPAAAALLAEIRADEDRRRKQTEAASKGRRKSKNPPTVGERSANGRRTLHTNKTETRPKQDKHTLPRNRNNEPKATNAAPPAPDPQLPPLDAAEVGIGFGDSSIEGGEDTQGKPQSPPNPPPSAVEPTPKPEDALRKFFGTDSYSSAVALDSSITPKAEQLAEDAVRYLADEKPQIARKTYLRFISRLGIETFKTHFNAVLDEIGNGKNIAKPGGLLVSRLKMAEKVLREGEAVAPPVPKADGNENSADGPSFQGDLQTIPDLTVDRLHALKDSNDIAAFACRYFGENNDMARKAYIHLMIHLGSGNFKDELATFMSEEAAGERVNNPAAVFTQRCKDQIARIKAKKEAAKQTSAG